METMFWPALSICALLCLIHILTVAVAIARCRPQTAAVFPAYASSVTLIRPVCGLDNYCEQTLRTSFTLDYGRYDILFCAASARDPVVPLVERLIAEHPGASARLLIGDERISQNSKLNNLCKEHLTYELSDHLILSLRCCGTCDLSPSKPLMSPPT